MPDAPIAFFGSSSFRLWASMAEDLGCLDVVNLGFGGATCASALHYLEKLLVPVSPERIVLYFGENDISNDGLTGDEAFAAYRSLVERLDALQPGVPIFALSAKQSPAKWSYRQEVDAFNTQLGAYCANKRGIEFIDVGSGLLGRNKLPKMRYFQNDLIHINQAGYALWASILRAHDGLLTGAGG